MGDSQEIESQPLTKVKLTVVDPFVNGPAMFACDVA